MSSTIKLGLGSIYDDDDDLHPLRYKPSSATGCLRQLLRIRWFDKILTFGQKQNKSQLMSKSEKESCDDLTIHYAKIMETPHDRP